MSERYIKAPVVKYRIEVNAVHLQNQHYSITASAEVKPDLSQFDIVHNPNDTNTDDFYMARIFRVQAADGTVRSIAVVDLLCAQYGPCAVLEGDILSVILFQSIVRIDLSAGALVQVRECDNMGGLHDIHAIDGGYILWGEGDIFRYDHALNRVWQFMGRDILVSLHSDRHFWIEQDRIHCRDFLGWHYVLDLDGKLIREFQEYMD